MQQTPRVRTESRTWRPLNRDLGRKPGAHRGETQKGEQRNKLAQHKCLIHHPSKREEQPHQHRNPARGGSTRNGNNHPRRGERNMSTRTKSSNGLSKSEGILTIPTTLDAPRDLSDRQAQTSQSGRQYHLNMSGRGQENSAPLSTRRRESPRALHKYEWKDTIKEMQRHLN